MKMSFRSVFLRYATYVFFIAGAITLSGCAQVHVAPYVIDKKKLTDANDILKEKKYPEALARFEDIVKTFPKSESARIALYKIGFINIYYDNPQADWSAALKAFRLFQKQYGDDPKIDEVNTWIRILVAMETFAAQYGESSQRIQKLKNKSLEKTESVEQLREEFLRCSFEKDSLNLEKNALLQKIKELEATILKIEKAQ
jgi:outer membrane protein assembly factor BamD (BamD/ComL family)